MFSIKVLFSFIAKCDKCYYKVRPNKIVNNGIIIILLLNDLDIAVTILWWPANAIAILYLFGKNSALFSFFFLFIVFLFNCILFFNYFHIYFMLFLIVDFFYVYICIFFHFSFILCFVSFFSAFVYFPFFLLYFISIYITHFIFFQNKKHTLWPSIAIDHNALRVMTDIP